MNEIGFALFAVYAFAASSWECLADPIPLHATNATARSGTATTTIGLPGIESSIDSFNNNGSVTCKKAHSSIDEFPPDFFTEEQRRDGAVVVHIFVAFYGFIFITLICHDYFLPSVFCICLDLGISSDVAGATFMAMATCISELFVTIIGTFLTESDLGVGTVVGSGVYNTLGVSACAGLAARKAITLDKWPLLRDSGAYMASIVTLALVAIDNVVTWYEALAMLAMYFAYVLFLFTQNKLAAAAKKIKNKNSFRSSETQNITIHENDTPSNQYGTEQQTTAAKAVDLDETNVAGRRASARCAPKPCQQKTNVLSVIWWAFVLPATFTLSVSVPDCRTNRKLYPLTFVMSIVWLSAATYVLSWMLIICGDTFHISDFVMGIAVLAIGSSIPEAMTGIINARNGEASMSISSALGANTMDVLLCLGLPWFVKCLLPASMHGGPVRITETDGSLLFDCACMLGSVVVLNAAAAVSGFKMHKVFGFVCAFGQVAVMAALIVNNGLSTARFKENHPVAIGGGENC